MITLEGRTVIHKLWYFLRTYILTVARFDLFLQGALLIVLLLEANVYLLLRRTVGSGLLPALVEDWVMMGSGGAEFLLGAALAWWGRGRRQLALFGWLGATAVAGLLVLAFPFDDVSPPSVELCGGGTIAPYTQTFSTDAIATARMVILIITAILCALTMISIWAHGLTYLDDHEPQNGPYFYGILISIRLSLGLSGQSWLRPGAVRDDWWVAHLSLSMLTLMFAVLFTLFPQKQPQWKEVNEAEDTGFFPSLDRVIRNKAIFLQTGALSFLNAALFGFIHYDTEFIQARFHVEALRQDPQTSRAVSNIFRPLVIIFFVMIFRVRFSVRRNNGVKSNTASKVGGVVAVFVAVFFSILAILDCGVHEITGLEGGIFEQPLCSQDCGCDSGRYGFTPVCALDTSTTYFSPCNAGCNDYENLNGLALFHNCTCGSARAVRGSCTLSSCRTSYTLYQVLFTVVVAVSAASLLMQGMVLLRAVKQRSDKAIAVGASFSIIALLSHVLGHLLYMLISHLTCAFESSGGGACVFHQPSLWSMAVVSAVLALCSAVVSLVASRVPSGRSDVLTMDNSEEK